VYDIGICFVKKHAIGAPGFLLTKWFTYTLNFNNVGFTQPAKECQGLGYLWIDLGSFLIER